MKIGDMQCPWHPGMTLFECQADHERVRDHARYTPEELDRERTPVADATPADVAEAEKRYGKTIEELADEAERGYDVSKMKLRKHPRPYTRPTPMGQEAPEWTI
jgi:hypothetical protein